MFNFMNTLEKCTIFKDFDKNEIQDLLGTFKYKIKEYEKNETIAIEDDKCLSLGIVLCGNVHIEKIYSSGKVVVVDTLSQGNIFGEVIIFSNINKYPSTIIATDKCSIMYIEKSDVISLCIGNPIILANFMELLSKKILMLNRKVKQLSYTTIRQKICNYLFNQYKKQSSTTIKLPASKNKISEEMGIPRPSLSRELINMKDEGLIELNKNFVYILDLDILESYL